MQSPILIIRLLAREHRALQQINQPTGLPEQRSQSSAR